MKTVSDLVYEQGIDYFVKMTKKYGPDWSALFLCDTTERRRMLMNKLFEALENAGVPATVDVPRTLVHTVTYGAMARFRKAYRGMAEALPGLIFTQIVGIDLADEQDIGRILAALRGNISTAKDLSCV